LKEKEPIKYSSVDERFALSIKFLDAKIPGMMGIKGMRVY
jgi:hypothetical protein